jgi:RNA polymerase sigma-70 factor (ECF subfamily)
MAAAQPRRTKDRRPAYEVARLPFLDSDRAIVAALRAGNASGGAALYDRHWRHVRRVVVRVLGPDADVGDVVQDVFLSAIGSLERLDEPDALRAWLSRIAVFRARAEIRRRTRRKWLSLFAPEDLPDIEAPEVTPETSEALRATYRVLSRLPADERIAFALRFIDGMELVEVADACEVSLATIKRRLARAQKRFATMAAEYSELSAWTTGGLR